MTQTLTQLVTSVQAFLLDDGTRFTTATITAAVRAALATWNQYAPINAATRIDAVTDQHDYELSDEPDASTAITITDILAWDDDGDEHIPLAYTQWTEDERIFFRLFTAQTTGDEILARFTQPHTVNGLDSATESTLSALFDNTLIKGAAAEACAIRSRSRTETINLQSQVTPTYAQIATQLRAEFLAELRIIAERNKIPTSYPASGSWQDSYHSWDQ